MLIGKYFDGKNSKAHKVEVKNNFNGLNLRSISGEGEVNRFWPKEGISTESFSSGRRIMLTYGEFPHERLELSGEGSEVIARSILDQESMVKSLQHKITRTGPIKLVLASLLTLVVVVYGYIFYVSPYVAEQAVKILPKQAEEKIGQVMYNNISDLINIDEEKSTLLDEFYEACGFSSEYEISIDYAKDATVNAFAVPGGQIVVFEGLIRETECWDELAALLGHELAHVNQRHSFKQLARAVSSYLVLSVLTGDVAGTSSVVLDYAAQVHELSNSRAHEKEADLVGLEYLKKVRIRPEAMIDLFQRFLDYTEEDDLIDMSETAQSGMEYLSTHPLTMNRINYIQEIIDGDSGFEYQNVEIQRAEEIWLQLKESAASSDEIDIIKKLKEKIRSKWDGETDQDSI